MPIKLNEIDKASKNAKLLYSPKFFSKDFTGSGKKTGLLNKDLNPVNIDPATDVMPKNIIPQNYIKSITNDTHKLTFYPLSPLMDFCSRVRVENFTTSCCKLITDSPNCEDFISLMPVNIIVSEPLEEKVDENGNKLSRSAIVVYLFFKYRRYNTAPPFDYNLITYDFTCNPLKTYQTEHANLDPNPKNDRIFMDYLLNYNIYDEICHLSELWQTRLTDIIIDRYDNDMSFSLGDQIRYIGQYKVSLYQYKMLYDELDKRLPPIVLRNLSKLNVNLLLQNTLKDLSQTTFAPLPAPSIAANRLDLSWCSKEQFDAITSTAPLNEVQAGAGTGKSTVIKARLDYLNYLGVDMNKVMVLSFTNAAADNIKNKCPGINSMTIARMIDDIYCQNHPTHQLSPTLGQYSESATFTNTLRMYVNTLPLAKELLDAVINVEKRNDYASLLNLVENNYDKIMHILDTIGQTTFQLEIIICYLEHATLKIPFEIEHLLIDEVQDNAIFEFIFFLNLTCKLKNHLYLVGDCSQTLYEFRASDPKALNAIEGSGVFATYPLNINYRSNQDILHFANVLLDDIDANQYANIQLQAFSLTAVTKQSFETAVTLDYNKLYRKREFSEMIQQKFQSTKVCNWIDEKLAKNEQICILAYKRRDVNLCQTILEKLYPNCVHTNIIPNKNTSLAYFSNYVVHNKNAMKSLPLTDANAICAEIKLQITVEQTHALNISNNNITSKQSFVLNNVKTMLDEWEASNRNVIQDMLSLFKANKITHDELITAIEKTLIDFEIKKNALRQSIISQKNACRKENTDNANFVYSTIHSAKGLEFDNTIVLYNNENNMSEENKRMYYVALTRAKKSEYIMSFDTVEHPLIQTRYDSLMAKFPEYVAVSA